MRKIEEKLEQLKHNLKQKLHHLFTDDDFDVESNKHMKLAEPHIAEKQMKIKIKLNEGHKKIFKTQVDRNKDGWEMATNWVRTFVDVYQCIFYLNSFAKLNRMACEQALRKISKKYL